VVGGGVMGEAEVVGASLPGSIFSVVDPARSGR